MEPFDCLECGCEEFTVVTNDDLTVVEVTCINCGLPYSMGEDEEDD